MGIPTLDGSQIAVAANPEAAILSREIAQLAIAALNTYPHYVVIEGYPAIEDPANLMALAAAICGVDRGLAVSAPRDHLQNDISFTKVHINPAKGMANKPVTQYSRTHLPLPAHTDSSYLARPHELVAFQCIISDSAGGGSMLVPISDLLSRLDAGTIQCLREPVYPFGAHQYPILFGASGEERIRYYQAQFERTQATGGPPLPLPCRSALETLDTVLQHTEHFTQFHLRAGQVLLMHNQKVLHGRTGFSPTSDRLLYRIRLHVDSLTKDSLSQHRSPQIPQSKTDVSSSSELLGGPVIPDLPQMSPPDTLELSASEVSDDLLNSANEIQSTEAIEGTASAARRLKQAKVHLVEAKKLSRTGRAHEALLHYRLASQLAPDNQDILSAHGKLLLRKGQLAEAAQVFCRCLKIEPTHYDSGLILSSLAHHRGDRKTAQQILHQTIQQHPYAWERQRQAHKATVLRLRGIDGSAYELMRRADGSYKYLLRGGHFSIQNLVEKQTYNWLILNLLGNNGDRLTDLPPVDLIVNTLACPDLKRSSLLAAARFCDRHPTIPLINPPRDVLNTTRERNSLRLNLIPGVKFPKTERLIWIDESSDKLLQEIDGLGFVFPIIIRQVGSQTGKSVGLVEDKAGLVAHLQKSPVNQAFYIIQFQDCRNAQGAFNKIRVFFVDGTLYPVANLFHDAWNVHSGDRYQIMDKTDWTQAAEKSFLKDPVSYLGQDNIDKLYQIRDVVKLDFFGVDLTILPDGTLFIFELNAAMRHNFDHAQNFPYTKPYLQQVSNAFNTMIQNRLAV